MIGDGMAEAQRTAAELFAAGEREASGRKTGGLAMNSLPVRGTFATHDADGRVTDSAAAATAFACGRKTTAGRLAVDPGGRTLPTLAQFAKAAGMRVGIVSSVTLDDATPAAFYAHSVSRSAYYDIALQISGSGVDYFAGSGLRRPTGPKKDRPDAFGPIRDAGYRVTATREDFDRLNAASGRVVVALRSMPYDIDRRAGEISLAEFTAKGIELLDNPKGFFMMVEGGKIDLACHANDAATAVRETVAFDDAVRVACDFCGKHPRETLVVVLGDHETGGMSVDAAAGKERLHSVLARQKGSYLHFDSFMAKYIRTHDARTARFGDVAEELAAFFGFRYPAGVAEGRGAADGVALDGTDVHDLREAFAQSLTGLRGRAAGREMYRKYSEYDPLTVAATKILARKAGIGWTTFVHTGAPMPVLAVGVGQELFRGSYDNTDVFTKLRAAMGP
jgi:alkaline phosphatase